jgi:hypothetical protein
MDITRVGCRTLYAFQGVLGILHEVYDYRSAKTLITVHMYVRYYSGRDAVVGERHLVTVSKLDDLEVRVRLFN